MRARILVVARDVDLRARLARLLNGVGHRIEIAESAAHARRLDLDGIALAIVAADERGMAGIGAQAELADMCGRTLLVANQGVRDARRADMVDASDEAALLARVAEELRPVAPTDTTPMVLRFAGYSLDIGGHSLMNQAGIEVPLTRSEHRLLHEFVQRPGRVLSRDYLLQALAGRDAETFDRSVDMLVVRLRRKIEADPKHPSLIVTVPGSGYKFAAKVSKAEATGSSEPESATPAPASASPVPERRHVTAISVELMAVAGGPMPQDPEELCSVIEAYRRDAAAVIRSYGGTVAGCHAREMLAYFGYPVAQEHAAERAVRAALAVARHRAGEDAAIPPGFAIRVGVASGLVIADPGGELLGEAPSEATRLHGLAEPGQVIIDAGTRCLTGALFAGRHLGKLAVTGATASIQAWEVLGSSTLASHSEALHADVPTPLVGREDELDLLLRRWRQARSGEGCLVLLSGEPGIGKSRLLVALEEELAGEAHVSLRYFCSPLHQDSALYPVIARWEQEAGFTRGEPAEQRLARLEAILATTDTPPGDVALIAGMLSIPLGARYKQPDLGPQQRKESTFAALRRRMIGVTRRQPALMLFEDAHWADPSSLELLDRLVDHLASRPILLVISFRPEFAPPWIGRAGTSLIALSRLDRRQSTTLAAGVSGARALEPALIERIVTQSDGVPLFIEEMTKAVLDSGLNAGGAAPAFTVPATLQASLMARLERLPGAKQVAQIGSVIGREFSHGLLAAVASLRDEQLAQGLDDLLASALVVQRGIRPNAVYTFKHALIRDAAYDSLPRNRRAEIHAAIVIAGKADASFAIEPGVLGYHCAEAGLTAEAASCFRRASAQSMERAASVETRMQIERGLQLTSRLPAGPDRDQLEAELLVGLGDVLHLTRGYSDPDAVAAFDRAIALGRSLDSPSMLARALDGRYMSVAQRGDLIGAQAIGDELLTISQGGDVFVSLIARRVAGVLLFWRGEFPRSSEQFATFLALRAREPDAAWLDWRGTTFGPAYAALVLNCLGYPERAARQLDLPDARLGKAGPYWLTPLMVLQDAIHDEVGLRQRALEQMALDEKYKYPKYLAQSRCIAGWLAARDGRFQEGLSLLRRGIAGLHELDNTINVPFYRGLEADALAGDGRRAEAMTVLNEALQMAREMGATWFVAELHRRRGELLLGGPRPDRCSAERELRQAIETARNQSARLFELRAATSLARLWAVQDRRVEARDLLAPVYGWFTEGFDTQDVRNAKSVLEDLQCSQVAN